MSWIPSSKGTALVVLIALALATAGTAAAISVSPDDVPDEAEAGSQVEATVVIEDPFVNTTDSWTLVGSTEIVGDSAEWTVTVEDQNQAISEDEYEGESFSHELNRSNGGDTVIVEVTGEAPSIDQYSYEPPQSFAIYDLNALSGNTQEDLPNANESVHHYTSDSRQARQAIDDARETINESGASGEAQSTLNQSISAFESGNFGNAESLASDAGDEAEQSQQSQETQQMILYGVAAIVVVALLGGGIYYWRNQQDDYGKLQ